MSFGDNAKLDLLIARTVSEEARTNGGSLYAASLRRLWDMAYSIGLNRGEKNLVDVRKEGYQEGRLAAQREATALSEELEKHAWKCGFHKGRLESEERLDRYAGQLDKAYSVLEGVQQTLEAERVWGFDVGWALGQEVERSRQHSEARLLPSLPSLVSTASMATQTDPLPTPDTVPDAPQPLLTSTIVPSVPFDWADDTTQDDPPMSSEPKPSCAIAPALSAPSTFMRDFSDLRTKSSQPFASLHTRRKRSARDPVCRPSHSRASRAPETSDDPSASSRFSPPTIILNIYDSNNKKRHIWQRGRCLSWLWAHVPGPSGPVTVAASSVWRSLGLILPFAASTEALRLRDRRSPLVDPAPDSPSGDLVPTWDDSLTTAELPFDVWDLYSRRMALVLFPRIPGHQPGAPQHLNAGMLVCARLSWAPHCVIYKMGGQRTTRPFAVLRKGDEDARDPFNLGDVKMCIGSGLRSYMGCSASYCQSGQETRFQISGAITDLNPQYAPTSCVSTSKPRPSRECNTSLVNSGQFRYLRSEASALSYTIRKRGHEPKENVLHRSVPKPRNPILFRASFMSGS
ncbi:hypothetical protein FB45DRAFT_877228 [Roridomyces roridus]|uniref:Uncharacterized protein n=1 Tax=Roridomyces roridus TaxID=1738132 RepID=A0AAD7B356_9AGAR|nr:hypothetical protein FB45DRAFT_877228 [Roridomyces roridus]